MKHWSEMYLIFAEFRNKTRKLMKGPVDFPSYALDNIFYNIIQYFCDSLSELLDFYSSIYDNKVVFGDFNLIEKYEILLKNKKIADVWNSYFDSVTDSLDFFDPLKLIMRILMHSKTFWKGFTITRV